MLVASVLSLALIHGLVGEGDLPPVPDDHPVHLDRTGIDWVLPFERARAISRETGRPLLIKAVAFGTTRSGCW